MYSQMYGFFINLFMVYNDNFGSSDYIASNDRINR
jgi:hypothetical protein